MVKEDQKQALATNVTTLPILGRMFRFENFLPRDSTPDPRKHIKCVESDTGLLCFVKYLNPEHGVLEVSCSNIWCTYDKYKIVHSSNLYDVIAWLAEEDEMVPITEDGLWDFDFYLLHPDGSISFEACGA